MAVKKNYFFQMKLLDMSTGEEIGKTKIKELIVNIMEHGKKTIKSYIDVNGQEDEIEYISLEVAPDNGMRVIVDVFEFKENYLFFRACKQRPSNTFTTRDYDTFDTGEISVDNETTGIELYTFCYYVYSSGIFSMIKNVGAPDSKIMDKIINSLSTGYSAEMIQIPNKKGIKSLYDSKDSVISQMELELPNLDVDALEAILGFKENELIHLVKNNKYVVNFIVKPINRGGYLSNEEFSIKNIIDAVIQNLSGYTKARVKGKEEAYKRTKVYDFLSDYYANEIDIPYYRIVDRRKKYYTVEQMVSIYKDYLVASYNESESIFREVLEQ